jgi:hypothetical protein
VTVANTGDSPGNDILRNSIFSNTGLGIDLVGGREGASGATANDGGAAHDADTGPNGLQNKPTLTSATTTGTTITIEGHLDTKPSTDFKVEFFSQPSGNEGKNFVGREPIDVAVHDPDGNGLYEFSFQFAKAVPVGEKITATATGPEGTSEFSKRPPLATEDGPGLLAVPAHPLLGLIHRAA